MKLFSIQPLDVEQSSSAEVSKLFRRKHVLRLPNNTLDPMPSPAFTLLLAQDRLIHNRG